MMVPSRLPPRIATQSQVQAREGLSICDGCSIGRVQSVVHAFPVSLYNTAWEGAVRTQRPLGTAAWLRGL